MREEREEMEAQGEDHVKRNWTQSNQNPMLKWEWELNGTSDLGNWEVWITPESQLGRMAGDRQVSMG